MKINIGLMNIEDTKRHVSQVLCTEHDDHHHEEDHENSIEDPIPIINVIRKATDINPLYGGTYHPAEPWRADCNTLADHPYKYQFYITGLW